MSDTDSAERRSSARLRLEVEVSLASDSHFFTGLSGDLSRGGVFVATYRDVPVGSEILLEFDLPSGHVRARGTVRWHRCATEEVGPGLGIVFDELAVETRELIENFCREREPLYYEAGDRASHTG